MNEKPNCKPLRRSFDQVMPMVEKMGWADRFGCIMHKGKFTEGCGFCARATWYQRRVYEEPDLKDGKLR